MVASTSARKGVNVATLRAMALAACSAGGRSDKTLLIARSSVARCSCETVVAPPLAGAPIAATPSPAIVPLPRTIRANGTARGGNTAAPSPNITAPPRAPAPMPAAAPWASVSPYGRLPKPVPCTGRPGTTAIAYVGSALSMGCGGAVTQPASMLRQHSCMDGSRTRRNEELNAKTPVLAEVESPPSRRRYDALVRHEGTRHGNTERSHGHMRHLNAGTNPERVGSR